MRDNIYVGLVHYPVYNRNSDVVATSITNFDIHDISRTCRTYDIKKYFIITPVDAQQELTNRIINYLIKIGRKHLKIQICLIL